MKPNQTKNFENYPTKYQTLLGKVAGCGFQVQDQIGSQLFCDALILWSLNQIIQPWTD